MRKLKGSLIYQVEAKLKAMIAFGESRHRAKRVGAAANRIYSVSTLRTYLDRCCRFTRWCAESYKAKDLARCRNLVPLYLHWRLSHGSYSRSTLATDVSALAKLFGSSASELKAELKYRCYPRLSEQAFKELLARSTYDATKSRAAEDGFDKRGKFREEFIIANATGLRQCCLRRVAPVNFIRRDGVYGVWIPTRAEGKMHGIPGGYAKGGRGRFSAILPECVTAVQDIVEAHREAAGELAPLFPTLPARMDENRYRHAYANHLYRLHARDVAELSRDERYVFRKGPYKGTVLDRSAMGIVAENLGHGSGRNVFAASYYSDMEGE